MNRAALAKSIGAEIKEAHNSIVSYSTKVHSKAELNESWYHLIAGALYRTDVDFLARHFVTSHLWLSVSKAGLVNFINKQGGSFSTRAIPGKRMAEAIGFYLNRSVEEITASSDYQKQMRRVMELASQIHIDSNSVHERIRIAESQVADIKGKVEVKAFRGRGHVLTDGHSTSAPFRYDYLPLYKAVIKMRHLKSSYELIKREGTKPRSYLKAG